jgi:hypothetical protein
MYVTTTTNFAEILVISIEPPFCDLRLAMFRQLQVKRASYRVEQKTTDSNPEFSRKIAVS